jgi:hypothetical protein
VDVAPEKLFDLVVVDLVDFAFLEELPENLVLVDLLGLDFDIDTFGAELFTRLKLDEREDDEKERDPPLNPLASARLGTINIMVNKKVNITFAFILLHPPPFQLKTIIFTFFLPQLSACCF